VRLRRAEPTDNDAVATVHVRSWQAAYRGLLPDVYLDGLNASDRADRYTFGKMGSDSPLTTVAVDGQVICGFSTTGLCRVPDATDVGEVLGIYVDPDWWDQGVGRMLIRDARDRMAAQGFPEAILWVLVGNEQAERFYRLDGWIPDGQQRVEEVHGIAVDELRYRRALP
jgi:ribosomal protein S18 acetylase RimI-like enzyme